MLQQQNNAMLCHTTPRLDAMKHALLKVRSFADIGCDHAYLSILTAREGGFDKIIASDIKEGPLKKAYANISRFSLGDKIETRLGSGLLTIAPGEVEAAVIAGMGADVICSVLHEGENIARSLRFIIMQPMTGAETLRRYLYTNGFAIKSEILVREDRRIYPIIIAESGDTGNFCEFDCYISFALQKSRGEHFEDYFLRQKQRAIRALQGLRKAKRMDEKTKIYEELVFGFEKYEKKMKGEQNNEM